MSLRLGWYGWRWWRDWYFMRDVEPKGRCVLNMGPLFVRWGPWVEGEDLGWVRHL